MKDLLFLLLCTLVLTAGCAGRAANPTPVYLPGDEDLSCTALKLEIAHLEVDMRRLLSKSDKGLIDALGAAAGTCIAIIPVGLKDAENVEFDAMRRRHNRLLVYAVEKDCDMMGVKTEKILPPEDAKEKKQAD
ncbi:MAG: hypothetical protein ACYSRZ_05225 [Planctomycetota bacterium]|jgi:hypothetical protein